jgi:NADH:ubiquinone oxidoreductase subunit E
MSKKVHICRGKSCKKADPKKSLEKYLKNLVGENHLKNTKCLGICKEAFAIEYKENVYSCPTKNDLEEILKLKK